MNVKKCALATTEPACLTPSIVLKMQYMLLLICLINIVVGLMKVITYKQFRTKLKHLSPVNRFLYQSHLSFARLKAVVIPPFFIIKDGIPEINYIEISGGKQLK